MGYIWSVFLIVLHGFVTVDLSFSAFCASNILSLLSVIALIPPTFIKTSALCVPNSMFKRISFKLTDRTEWPVELRYSESQRTIVSEKAPDHEIHVIVSHDSLCQLLLLLCKMRCPHGSTAFSVLMSGLPQLAYTVHLLLFAIGKRPIDTPEQCGSFSRHSQKAIQLALWGR